KAGQYGRPFAAGHANRSGADWALRAATLETRPPTWQECRRPRRPEPVIRSFIISSLTLSLLLVSGCDKPPAGTTPPDDDSGQTADKGKKDKKDRKDKGDKGDKGDDTSGDDLEDPTKKVCPAETAD